MVNKEILQKILKTESVAFSYEEIQQLLDEELEKSPDEMDTQLVDLCVEVLSRQNIPEQKEPKKHKRIRATKVLLVAAVFVAIAVFAISVGAKVLNIENEGSIIRFFENHILINLTGENKYDLSVELKNYGIQNDSIPSKFFNDDCVITDVQLSDNNSYIFYFELTDTDVSGHIGITKYAGDWDFAYNYANVYSDVEQMKHLIVNEIDIFVYSSVDEKVNAVYQIDGFKYTIFFSGATFDEVTEIIENF